MNTKTIRTLQLASLMSVGAFDVLASDNKPASIVVFAIVLYSTMFVLTMEDERDR